MEIYLDLWSVVTFSTCGGAWSIALKWLMAIELWRAGALPRGPVVQEHGKTPTVSFRVYHLWSHLQDHQGFKPSSTRNQAAFHGPIVTHPTCPTSQFLTYRSFTKYTINTHHAWQLFSSTWKTSETTHFAAYWIFLLLKAASIWHKSDTTSHKA